MLPAALWYPFSGFSRRPWILTLPILVAACGANGSSEAGGAEVEAAAARSKIEVIDDAGRSLRLDQPATRIISLLPAATEVLIALGARDQLVARTTYDYDPDLAELPSIGGGLTPSLEQIVSLGPDLIIAWEEAGVARIRPRLEALNVPVFAARTEDTTAIFANIERFGRLTGLDANAAELSARLRSELNAVRTSVEGRKRPAALYLISTDPPLIAGPNLFIGQLMDVAGGANVFHDISANSPQMSLEEILARRPQVVLLPASSPGAGDILAARPGWRELARGGTRFAIVAPDSIHRPGAGIGNAARILRDAIHPELAGSP